MGEDQFLMASDAAKVLGKTPASVRYYASTGKLPAIRTVGGARLFKAEDVRRLAVELSRKSQGAAPAPV